MKQFALIGASGYIATMSVLHSLSRDVRKCVRNLLDKIVSTIKPRDTLMYWPQDMNIEITTLCNSRCIYCTHEQIMKSGKRKPKHMDHELARYVISKLRDISRRQGIPEGNIRFSPVGLGEPLLHPHFFDVIAYARKIFPKALVHANTNCIGLNDDIARKLAASEIDKIILSLNFCNSDSYKNYTGVDKYDLAVKNIRNFLRIKRKTPKAKLQIFSMDVNKDEIAGFKKEWEPLSRYKHDTVTLSNYIPLTDTRFDKKKAIHPCDQLWSVSMVDVDGFVFPCCLSVWRGNNEDLRLGHITDDSDVLIKKLEQIRNRHLKGDYGSCISCAYLYEQKNNRRLRTLYRTIERDQKEGKANETSIEVY